MVSTLISKEIDLFTPMVKDVYLSDPKYLSSDYINSLKNIDAITYTPILRGGLLIVHRRVIEKGLRFDEKLSTEEDRDFSLRSRLKGFCTATANSIYVYNVKNPNASYYSPYTRPLEVLKGLRKRVFIMTLSYLYKFNFKSLAKILFRALLFVMFIGVALSAFLSLGTPQIFNTMTQIFLILFLTDFAHLILKYHSVLIKTPHNFMRLIATSYLWTIIDILIIITLVYMIIFTNYRSILRDDSVCKGVKQ
ncbi:MAG: hypothetical protein ACP5I7_03595 [Sulfolobales archaeon]